MAVFAVEVPGGACASFKGSGGVGREGYYLHHALVLGAIDKREGAVGAGAVGARGGVVGEDFALGAGELVAAGAGVDSGGSFVAELHDCRLLLIP